MDPDVMPESLMSAFEAVYRDYAAIAASPADTLAERHELARCSAAVAVVLRKMAAVPGLAWWTVAAL